MNLIHAWQTSALIGLPWMRHIQDVFCLAHLTQVFDAVVCFNEMQALGCIEALQAAGIRVPEDVSVASMYGTEVSSLVHPSITSIEKSVLRMAEEAVRLILRQIANPMAPPSEVVIPSDVVIRESS